MPTATTDAAVASPQARHRLVAFTLAQPLLWSTLGIDGGDLFQMVAVENLGLDARTIGIGLGFSVVSVPVQLWAARLRLDRARQRLQAFLLIDAVLCGVLALLVVTARPGSGLAASALALAVVAEIVLSVLFVTAWQPLLSLVLEARDRQRINAQAKAIGRSLTAGVLLLFGLANETTRVAFLVAVAVLAVVLARMIRCVPVPPVPAAEPTAPAAESRSFPAGTALICVTAGISALSAWPLFVTYTHDVFWPDVNLGLVATAQLAGHVVAGLRWRTAVSGLVRRARWAAGASVLGAAGLAAIRVPVDSGVEAAVTLLIVAGSAAAIGTFMLCTIERLHQVTDHARSVRAMTVFDVVASTSLQAGFLLAGLLVSASEASSWPVDPYRTYLVTTAALMTLTVLRPDSAPGGSATTPAPRGTPG